jgi:hypothetical protein
MSIELTEPQQQALDRQQGDPLRVVDPRTREAYVLLPAAVYDRVKELLEEAEDKALQKAWLDMATKTRRKWVEENPY